MRMIFIGNTFSSAISDRPSAFLSLKQCSSSICGKKISESETVAGSAVVLAMRISLHAHIHGQLGIDAVRIFPHNPQPHGQH